MGKIVIFHTISSVANVIDFVVIVFVLVKESE